MHLTLHFEADADANVERLLRDGLVDPIPLPPFGLRFQGLGFFPARGAPRVLWLGVGGGLDGLNAVWREVVRRVAPLHRRQEAFRPHLTLARFRDRTFHADLVEMTAFRAEAGPSRIDRVTLYESRLSPTGPSHAALAEALLKAVP
jgi:2'-5' RNA ligase